MKLQSLPVETRYPAGGETSQILADWPSDVPFTFDEVLRRRPELADRQSIHIDLAYEEYCQLEGRQGQVNRQSFAARFPQFERSLLRVLDLHSFCQHDSDIRRTFFAKPWPEAGEAILGFQLVEEIGRGFASRVFLATDPDLSGRLVVIKVGRALDEAAALGKLEHPGIVPVHYARIDPATELSVLCMPYWGRGTLLHLIDRLHADGVPQTGRALFEAAAVNAGEDAAVPLPGDRPGPPRFTDAVAMLGASLAEALAFAHAKGIVHSDVKPSNVLVTADGRPLLLDFNLARESEADERLVGGTLPYMAPEQLAAWARHTGPIGPASDVFSLGATLYELLMGTPPFGRIDEPDVAKAAAMLAERHRQGVTPIPPERLRGNRQLGRLIAACLSDNPNDRPTAAALATALAASVTPPRPASSWTTAAAVAAIAAGVVVATSTVLLRGNVEPTPRTVATAPALSDASALADRGWEHLSNNELQLAFKDLKSAYALDRSPRNAAAYGYCIMRLAGDWERAARLFREAVAGGEDSAFVWNALGYCELKLDDLDQAKVSLERALEADSRFAAAHSNRILLDLIEARKASRRPDLSIVRTSLTATDASAVAYFDAACAFAQACAVGERLESDVIEYCKAAVARGLDPQDLKTVATFHPELTDSESFRRLTQQPMRADVSVDVFSERVPPPFPWPGESRGFAFSFAGR